MGTKRCPYAKDTFRALQWASKRGLWIICKSCRRYRPLPMAADIAERQFTRTRFVCKRCGTRGLVTGDDPAKEPLWHGSRCTMTPSKPSSAGQWRLKSRPTRNGSC
jgi:hypothetical protein